MYKRQIQVRTAKLVRGRVRGIQFKIQFEHIYAGFAEETELPSFSMSTNHRAQIGFTNVTFLRNARDLKFRRSGRNVRIQSGARRRDQINRNRHGRVFCAQPLHIAVHAIYESFIRGPKK
jgi:hypothetical protein